MPLSDKLKALFNGRGPRFDEARIRLARPDSVLPLALLGLLSGLVAGGLIIVFRLLVEGTQEAVLPGEGPEDFESLSGAMRVALPLLAALLLAAMFRWLAAGVHVVGVAQVLERMAYHQGRFRVRELLVQFCGAALAIVGGHSVGREGPHVFLGAASGSLLGQALALPNNALRTLVGCGTAAGIAASFNTPLAGVVFALEVVMLEYTVPSFIPVILAAVSATALANWVFDDQAMFGVLVLEAVTLYELALALVVGVIAGAASAAYIHAVQTVTSRCRVIPIWWRVLIAGVLMGGIAFFIPEVMGIGYDSVERALTGEFTLGLLLVLCIGKLFATALCIGLGVPGGTIGPALFIGAMLGALIAGLATQFAEVLQSQVGLLALLGMGAMMSGSLHAPLAALTAMLELADSPQIILPGMLAVVVAGVTTTRVFGKDSLFIVMLRANGLDYGVSPVTQALRRIGVASVMERSIVRVGGMLSLDAAHQALEGGPVYLLIDVSNQQQVLMPAADLARYLQTDDLARAGQAIDLGEIPASRLQVTPIDFQASLQEAWVAFEEQGAEVLAVRRITAPGIQPVFGVVTREAVDRAYLP